LEAGTCGSIARGRASIKRRSGWTFVATDVSAAAEHLSACEVERCDKVEPLPEGMAAFWIKNPAGVVHLVTDN